MGNEDQIRILLRGTVAWNTWMKEHTDETIDLSKANLSRVNLGGANLSKADLSYANLCRADLHSANLYMADLRNADLRKADLSAAYLNSANLEGANLSFADLFRADLQGGILNGARLIGSKLLFVNFNGADLVNTDLSGANLVGSILVAANLEGANFTSCNIFGISVWNNLLKNTIQKDLVISTSPLITVDNLEVAQFIYLLLNNENLRDVIDTITSKVVLILGRFTSERKTILDAIREELRNRNHLPILFDFTVPASRDIAETVSTLAHMARFIIVDITDAKSIPAELAHIVPELPSVPVQPLILDSDYEYGLFEHIRRYSWVLEPYRYRSQKELLASLQEKVIAPVEAKAKEIRNN